MELVEKFKWQDRNDYHIPSLAICGNCKHKKQQFCLHPDITSEGESSMDFLEVSTQAVCNKHDYKYETTNPVEKYLAVNSKDMPADISQIVHDNFNELLDGKK